MTNKSKHNAAKLFASVGNIGADFELICTDEQVCCYRFPADADLCRFFDSGFCRSVVARHNMLVRMRNALSKELSK